MESKIETMIDDKLANTISAAMTNMNSVAAACTQRTSELVDAHAKRNGELADEITKRTSELVLNALEERLPRQPASAPEAAGGLGEGERRYEEQRAQLALEEEENQSRRKADPFSLYGIDAGKCGDDPHNRFSQASLRPQAGRGLPSFGRGRGFGRGSGPHLPPQDRRDGPAPHTPYNRPLGRAAATPQARPTVARKAREGSGEELFLLLLAVHSKKGSLDYVDLLTTHSFRSWATSRENPSVHAFDSLVSMPLPPVAAVDEMQQYVESALGGISATVSMSDLLPLAAPIAIGEDSLVAAARLTVALPDETEASRVLEELLQNHVMADIMDINHLQHRLSVTTATSTLYSAASGLVRPESKLALELVLKAAALCAMPPQPTAADRDRGDPRDFGGDRPPYYSGGYAVEHKRQRWRDGAIADISAVLPQPEPGEQLGSYHRRSMRAIHTRAATRMPNLMRETRPFAIIMQASVLAHATSITYKHMLDDATSQANLRNLFTSIEEEYRPTILDAMRDPEDERYQDLMLGVICRGFTAIRCVLLRTSPQGVLTSEASVLISQIHAARIDSTLDYVADVDTMWSNAAELWGVSHLGELCSGGTLSAILPAFVARLEPNMQDRALAYFNSVVHSYQSMSKTNPNLLPLSVRNGLSQLTATKKTLATQPQYTFFEQLSANRQNADETNSMLALLADAEPRNDVNSRMLTVPADLYPLAGMGLLVTHWRPFIDRLLGGYTRLRLTPAPPPASEPPNPRTMYAAGAAQDSSDEDDDDPPASDLLPVTRRSGQGGPASEQPPEADEQPGSSRPARNPSDRRNTPRVKFNLDTADKIVKATTGAAESFRSDIEKAGSTFEKASQAFEKGFEKATERLDKLESTLGKQVDAIHSDIDRTRKEAANEQAQFLRTAEQLIRNVASNTTSLTHANAMNATRDQLLANAGRLEAANSIGITQPSVGVHSVTYPPAAAAGSMSHPTGMQAVTYQPAYQPPAQPAVGLQSVTYPPYQPAYQPPVQPPASMQPAACQPAYTSPPQADAMGAHAASTDRSALSLAALSAGMNAAEASGRQRPRDDTGLKLTHLPENDFDAFSDEVKGLYRDRDNVHNKADFLKIARRLCTNCPKDQRNMPHEEIHCPQTYMSTRESEAKLGKVRVTRGQQRLHDNMARLKSGKPANTFAVLLEVANAMDDAGMAGGGHADACLHLAQILPQEVHPDTDVSTFVALCEAHAAEARPAKGK
jgi:hypothetical protein